MSPAGNAPDVENAVRSFRTQQGLTQEELGQKVGVTRQSIIAIEKGRFTPSIQTALRLAGALETAVDALFWLKEQESGEASS